MCFMNFLARFYHLPVHLRYTQRSSYRNSIFPTHADFFVFGKCPHTIVTFMVELAWTLYFLSDTVRRQQFLLLIFFLPKRKKLQHSFQWKNVIHVIPHISTTLNLIYIKCWVMKNIIESFFKTAGTMFIFNILKIYRDGWNDQTSKNNLFMKKLNTIIICSLESLISRVITFQGWQRCYYFDVLYLWDYWLLIIDFSLKARSNWYRWVNTTCQF